MPADAVSILIHLVGFLTGAGLYVLLLVLASRTPPAGDALGGESRRAYSSGRRFAVATAMLGLAWNVGAFAAYGLPNLGIGTTFAVSIAAAFTALGFLPAAVVHSVVRGGSPRGGGWIVGVAYTLAVCASAIHLYMAAAHGVAPAPAALYLLTVGFTALIGVLLYRTRRQPGGRRTVWVAALAVFAVSALHLSQHQTGGNPWWIEIVGHHASLPLAFAILYQDYRFAFADIFLKRAVAVLMLVGVAFGTHVAAGERLMAIRDAAGNTDPRALVLLLGLWVAMALAYPVLRGFVDRFIDRVVLRRVDVRALRVHITGHIDTLESEDRILDEACRYLTDALTARSVTWRLAGQAHGDDSRPGLAVAVPTVEAPHYLVVVGDLGGGRRLLSDDFAFLESVTLLVARRLDAVRVTRERWERTLREEEMARLATEAELRALRAQINPHFLFNALTTIGYLIQTAPSRALDTLMRLTGVLRLVLRRSAGEFATLGEELELIESYLDIERARFEDRLHTCVDVADRLRGVRIPVLLLQPLVENAVKHGVASRRSGGLVTVIARLEDDTSGRDGRLIIAVRDTGAGFSIDDVHRGPIRGVGLENVERRLRAHYGPAATLRIVSGPGKGTTVELSLPVDTPRPDMPVPVQAGDGRP